MVFGSFSNHYNLLELELVYLSLYYVVVVGIVDSDTVVAAVVVVVDTVAAVDMVEMKLFDTVVAVDVVVVDTVAVVVVVDTVAAVVGPNLDDSVAEHVDSVFVFLASLPVRKKKFVLSRILSQFKIIQ